MNFSGNISILYWCIAFIMRMGIIILLLALKLSQGKTYTLYKKGILAEGKGQSKVQLFEDLEDLHLFSSGRTFLTNNIAFRSRKEDGWEIITARYTNVMSAIDFSTTQHEKFYVPKVKKEPEQNKIIKFQYINYSIALSKKLFATGTSSEEEVYDANPDKTPIDFTLFEPQLIKVADVQLY